MMTNKKIMIWGFAFAGVLFVITGLRDIYAPGFFSMSPRMPGTGDIIGNFVAALAFFGVAVLSAKLDLDRAKTK
jgi:hypothetical protein